MSLKAPQPSPFQHLETGANFTAKLTSTETPQHPTTSNYLSYANNKCCAPEEFGTPNCGNAFGAAYFNIFDEGGNIVLKEKNFCAGCLFSLGIADPHANSGGGSKSKRGRGKYIATEVNTNITNEQPYSIKIKDYVVGGQKFIISGGHTGVLDELGELGELYDTDRSGMLPNDLNSSMKKLIDLKPCITKTEGKGRKSPFVTSSIFGTTYGLGATIDTWSPVERKMRASGFGRYIDSIKATSGCDTFQNGCFGLYLTRHLDEKGADDTSDKLPQVSDEDVAEMDVDDGVEEADLDSPDFIEEESDEEDEEDDEVQVVSVKKPAAKKVGKKRVKKRSKRLGYFRQHRDKKYKGKPQTRGIGTIGRSHNKDGMPKIMRIHDRKYGRWVDIVCESGTFLEMGWLASGTDSPRFTHSVHYAEGTYFIIVDYGRDVE